MARSAVGDEILPENEFKEVILSMQEKSINLNYLLLFYY